MPQCKVSIHNCSRRLHCLFTGTLAIKTHDTQMLHDSGLLEKVEANMPGDGNGVVYAMYGDLAYAQSIYLLGGFQKPPTGSDKALFNRLMSSV